MTLEEQKLNKEIDRLIDLERSELESTFDNKHKEMELMNNLIKVSIAFCREQGFKEHLTLWNTALYLNIASFDISVSIKNIAILRQSWERQTAARTTAILLYEVAKDFRKLLGKPFRNSLTTLGVLEKFENDLANAQRPLKDYWEANQLELRNIRVTAYGHREMDGYKLLEIIQAIDPHRIWFLAMHLSQLLDNLAKVLQEIMKTTSTIRK